MFIGRKKLCKLFFLILLVFASCTSKKKADLNIYTYSSFAGHYGPGPDLVKIFEQDCHCTVNMIDAGDAGTLLQRLVLEKNLPADLVVGLDQLSLEKAQSVIQWQSIKFEKVKWSPLLPDNSKLTEFLPYDYAPLTFIYRKGEIEPPTQFEDFKKPEYHKSMAFQDPRTSTPGLQMLLWMAKPVEKDQFRGYLKSLMPSVKKLSPSWSASYGYFQQKKVKLVFSYVTSLVYHWKQKNQEMYQGAVFPNGHPVQIEYFGIPKSCRHCDLAKRFAALMLSPQGQKLIAEKNYMLPVTDEVKLDPVFSRLPKLKILPLDYTRSLMAEKNFYIDQWYAAIHK